MADLRQSLNALLEHPPVPATPVEVVVARGRRFARRRRVLRTALGFALVVVASGAGLSVVAQQHSEPGLVLGEEGAAPTVSYTDDTGDAVPAPATGEPESDIVRVGWGPASDVDGEGHEGYFTSILIAGPVRDGGAFVSYGEFPSDVPGETCQLYHLLTPGTTAFANAFCGSVSAGTRRLVGRVQGGPVTSTTTAAGGILIQAKFDDSALPPLLEAQGRMLSTLSAFTCTGWENSGCDAVDILDFARSTLTYRL